LPVRAASSALTASFCFGLYKPHLFGILAKVFKEKNFRLSLVFKRVLKEFLSQKDFILFVFGFLENQRKLGFWEIVLFFVFYHLQVISQVDFLCCWFPKTPCFHT